MEAQRPATKTRERRKAHGSPAPSCSSGPVRKSLGGTGGTRGTARPRDQNPGAASARARRSRRNGRTSREKNSRTARRRNGRWVRPTSTRRRSTAGLINTAKGRSEPHGRRRAPKGARPGRDNSPNRGPGTCAEGKAATNDPRGRRLHDHSTKAPETRGAKNRKGEFAKTALPTWASTARDARTNAAAGWSAEVGCLRDGTARPANAEGTRIANPHERWPTGLSAASAAGGNRPAR